MNPEDMQVTLSKHLVAFRQGLNDLAQERMFAVICKVSDKFKLLFEGGQMGDGLIHLEQHEMGLGNDHQLLGGVAVAVGVGQDAVLVGLVLEEQQPRVHVDVGVVRVQGYVLLQVEEGLARVVLVLQAAAPEEVGVSVILVQAQTY
jgi:hypothetical protein